MARRAIVLIYTIFKTNIVQIWTWILKYPPWGGDLIILLCVAPRLAIRWCSFAAHLKEELELFPTVYFLSKSDYSFCPSAGARWGSWFLTAINQSNLWKIHSNTYLDLSKWFKNNRGVETHQLEGVSIFGIALLSMDFVYVSMNAIKAFWVL